MGTLGLADGQHPGPPHLPQLPFSSPAQYALYKKMTQAAILIQSKFRSYYEQKKFQQSRRAAVLIQQYYRSYKEYEKLKQGHRASAAMQQKIKWVLGGWDRTVAVWGQGG